MASGTEQKRFNPFPGLRPFTEQESHLFFGRDDECEQITGKLLMNRYITVIGESGTGKTSLIAAGVIPAIKSMMKDVPGWRIISLRPGNDPFINFARALEKQMPDRQNSGERIHHDSPDGITGMIRNLGLTDTERILLVIDQFEDLFIPKNSAVRGRFIDSLVRTASQPSINIYLLIAIRAEFMPECSRYQGLTHLVNSSSYLLPPMTRECLREAIEKPMRYGNARPSPDLVSEILDDIGERVELPVLQHALMRTWEKWLELEDESNPVAVTDYSSAGTVRNAISIQADEIFLELTQRARTVCERIFRTLIVEDSEKKYLIRPSPVSELMHVTGSRFDEVCSVLDRFRMESRTFLNPEHNVTLTEDTFIAVSYECVIRSWGRLNDWIEAEAESVKMYLKLSEASALYQQGKTRLLKQPDLQLALNWRNKEKPTLDWARRYDPAFERVMVYLRTSEYQSQLEEESRSRQQKARFRRIRVISGIFGTATIIAAVFMIDAILRKYDSDNRAAIAEKARIEEEHKRMLADSVSRDAERRLIISEQEASQSAPDVLPANEQLRAAPGNSRPPFDTNDTGEFKELARQRDDAERMKMVWLAKAMSMKSIQLPEKKDLQAVLSYQAWLFNKEHNGHPNDADIYAGLYNSALKLSAASCRTLGGHKGKITGIAFLPGKNEFYTSGADGQVLKWDLSGKEKTFQVVYSGENGSGSAEIIEVMAVSPDSEWLACGSSKSIRMIPVRQGRGSYVLQGNSGSIRSLVFSYDGKFLYSAALDGKVLKWDLAARTSSDVSGGRKITSIEISAGGKFFAGLSSDGKVLVVDSEKQSESFSIEAHDRVIRAIRFNPVDNILAVGDESGQVDFYDVVNRKRISTIKAHEAVVGEIRFNPALKQVATACSDGELKIFDFGNPADLSIVPLAFREESFISVLEFSSDGQLLIAGSSDGKLTTRPVHADYLARDISGLLTRNLSGEEWNMYVSKDVPYEETIPKEDFRIRIMEIRN